MSPAGGEHYQGVFVARLGSTAACSTISVMGVAVVRAILRRPWLAVEALRVAAAFAPRGWWRHPPFLPRPHPEYLQWRLHTHHAEAVITPDDVNSYLRWRRAFRAAARGAL